jgi:ABC-type antimicrobial peptide transport system permease subunit
MPSLRDLASEAMAAVLVRPTRLAINALGITLGVLAVVATTGLVGTAGAQIVSRFDALAATEVRVAPTKNADGTADSVLPFDAEQRLGQLSGVVASAAISVLPDVTVRGVASGAGEGAPPAVVAASAGVFAATHAGLDAGRWFDQGHDSRADQVAVIGRDAAKRLQLTDIGLRPTIVLNDVPFTVIGVLGTAGRQADLVSSVIIPDGSARALTGLAAPQWVLIDTKIGYAGQVAAQAALALAPQAPSRLTAVRAPDAAVVRARVATDVRSLFLILGSLSLLIGAVGISNTMLVSVIERTGEIGLRRSLGGTRAAVALQFLIESSMIGAVGGVIGSSLGVLTLVSVSMAQGWSPVLQPWLPPATALLATVVGTCAGAYPAIRAANLQPIAALRMAA